MLFSSVFCPWCISSWAAFQVISNDSQVAAPGDGRVDKLPRRESRVRWGRWVPALAIVCLSAVDIFAPSAEAQTAHFSWAVSTLGNGFSFPNGVALDGSGNVFVADTDNNTVKEVLAADGYTTVNMLGRGFLSPSGVALDGGGNNVVKEILVTDGTADVSTGAHSSTNVTLIVQ
jgi:secreted PhoX family phosphatase